MTSTPAQKPEPFVTVEEVAEILGVKVSWVYEAAAAGRIPSVLVGRYRRFRITDVINALTTEADRELVDG